MDVELDYDEMGELLRSQQMRNAMMKLAQQVASNVNAGGKPVTIRSYVTDRAASAVSIAHPSGLSVQARTGALTRAAASVGLEVQERRPT